jgi:hypothetical protein
MEAARVNAIFEEALRVKRSEKAGPVGVWTKNEPWLRLLHCILEDDIRQHYLQRDRVASRPELDAMSLPDRPMSVYKRIAIKWNDPLFNPVTSVSTCHEDFSNPIDIGWDAVVIDGGYAPPNEETVHHRLTDMRTKLVRIIKNWERSGQGEGTEQDCELEVDNEEATICNRDPDELSPAQLGHLENRSAYAMHSRQNFLDHPSKGKVGSWILYYWEQMERFDLLECTINILSDDVNASDAQSAPVVVIPSSAQKKRSRSPHINTIGSVSETDDDAIRQVSEGLLQYVSESKQISSRSMLTSRRRELETRIFELSKNVRTNEVYLLHCDDDSEKKLMARFVEEDKDEKKKKEAELVEVVARLKDLGE